MISPLRFLKLNPIVKYELRIIMLRQCRFINYNKSTTLVQDVNNWGGWEGGGVKYMGSLCTPTQFCYEPKLL